MFYKPRHFILEELVCPHVFKEFGEMSWPFFDDKLLMTIDLLRDQLGPIFINNWDMKGKYDERGFRCIRCSIVKDAIEKKTLYVSPHMTGQGFDFDVKGMPAEKVRTWIINNAVKLPYPVRLERDVSWVHLDTRDYNKGKVSFFNAY